MSWSDAPIDILSEIVRRLDTRSDILSFRAVCGSWSRSAPLSLLSGKNILSPILPHKFTVKQEVCPAITSPNNYLLLVASSVFLVRSVENPNIRPWIFMAEELNPGKLLLRMSLSQSVVQSLPQIFPKELLDLSRFQISEICKFYTIYLMSDSMCDKKSRDDSIRRKAVLCENHNEGETSTIKRPNIDDCAIMMLHENYGLLGKIKIDGKDTREVGLSAAWRPNNNYMMIEFDDIVNFKGRVCAIDRRGRLYQEVNGVIEDSLVVNQPLFEGMLVDRNKRLVESCGELYLIYRCSKKAYVPFKVYKLDEGKKEWEELKGIGDDRILVATHDGCFFVPAKDLSPWSGNSVVFLRGSFSANVYNRADVEIFRTFEKSPLDTAIYCFGECKWKLFTKHLSYSKVLWPPPSDANISNQKSSFQKNGEALGVIQNYHKSISGKPSNSQELQEDTLAKDSCSSTHIQENLSVEDVGALGMTTKMQNTTTIAADSMLNSIKSDESGVSKTKFQGIDVRSDLIPILESIWAKHGSILEGHPTQSSDIVAWALESMAKIVILFQKTAERPLSDSEADYLWKTIHDLKCMHFNVSCLITSAFKS